MPETPTFTSATWLSNLDHADPIVLGVLYLLLAMSVLTWFLIVYKVIELWWARRANNRYAKRFWEVPELAALHGARASSMPRGPFAQLTANGLTALEHYREHHSGMGGMVGNLADVLTRALRQCIQDQMTHFERGLGLLATIGNTAPFVGLFGTVIGIMSALIGIAEIGAADLSVVSGPVGEALIATAAGIACAIPAVVGYNSLVRRLRVFNNSLDSFAYDLLARLASEQAARFSSEQPSRQTAMTVHQPRVGM